MPASPRHPSNADQLLASLRSEVQRYRRLAEGALAQVSDEDFFRPLDVENNTLALLVKHVGGNLRSRWRDFLTSDGEKPDRDRDGEFELRDGDSRAALTALWNAGWGELESSLAALSREDLGSTVTIRGEPHSVILACERSLAHTAYHVGQIVLLAKHWRGSAWRTLSVARGGSAAFNVAMAERFAK